MTLLTDEQLLGWLHDAGGYRGMMAEFERQVLEALLVEHATIAELAAALGLPKTTTKYRLRFHGLKTRGKRKEPEWWPNGRNGKGGET